MSDRIIYLPMDVKVRELHGKVLLAAAAAARGYKVVLGRKKEASSAASALPAGFFLSLGAQENFAKRHHALSKKGHAVMTVDEEGLVTFSDDMYKHMRVSADTLSGTNCFFTWGDAHKRNVETVCESTQYVSAGNPRFDVLRPEFQSMLAGDVAQIKAKYGRYMLVISSFASCNHFIGEDKYFASLFEKKIIRNEADEQFFQRYFALKKKVFEEFLASIPAMAKAFPDHAIILRPHPAEDHSRWLEVAKGHDNVHVVHEGNVNAWILGCDALVHHFCTTAIEAYAAGAKAIAFRPYADADIETTRPYACSLEVSSQADLIAALTRFVNDQGEDLTAVRARVRDEYASYVANIEGAAFFETFLDVCDGIEIKQQGRKLPLSLRVLRHRLRQWRASMKNKDSAYLAHKFPPLQASEIQGALKSLHGKIPGAERIKISKVDESCFLLSL